MNDTDYCLECHNLGFVIMGNNDRNKVERCDTCRRFDDDEEATKALDQFIAKHAPPAPAEPRKASNGSEIVTMVDLTPAGAMTPEGVARINAAMCELQDANAALSNFFAQVCRTAGNCSEDPGKQALVVQKALSPTYCDGMELADLLRRKQRTEGAFVRAVAGRT